MVNNGPLNGVRIIEFTSAWAGPYATCLLGFLGAEVIKVESRQRPDHSRLLSFTTGRNFETLDESEVFNNLNLNKRSISLNLKKPKAVEIAKKLVKGSDVVMENMRPGVAPRLGLGYEALREIKADIIYLSSSACGQTGPDREYVGYAPTFAALAGLPHITGYEDWPPSNFMGSIDLRSACTSTFAILAALYYHQQTGEGQYIDLASQEAIAAFAGDIFLDYVMNRRVQMRKGNKDDVMAPHNCYRCLGDDKWISIAVATQEEWEGLCRVMDKPELMDDDRFSDSSKRKTNEEALDRIINEWTKNQDYYDAMKKLQKAGVAAAPSLSSEALFHDPHLKEREVFRQVDHPVIGKNWVIGPPWKLSGTPATIRSYGPLLGEHTDEIFQNHLGMSPEEIQTLKEEQVIY
jgi:crotonobetainyl-CoA:carnitine CoA-transferase CaiB-like acyl-CoA transferase